MNEKHREVSSWLEHIFGSESVPQYEVNSFTIDRLYQLMKRNEEQDRCGAILLADLQDKIEEYRLEAERLGGILDKMGLLPGSLSQSGTASLRTLTSTAVILDVADASNTNLLLAMSELSQQNMKVAEARRIEQRSTAQLFNKTKGARQQANNLERAIAGLEDQAKKQGPELQGKAKQAGFLTSKAREYKHQIQELQAELHHNKVDPSVYHSALLKKSEELKSVKEELQPMKARLSSYHQLPPDMTLSKVKVEEIRRELAEIEEELSKKINLLHM